VATDSHTTQHTNNVNRIAIKDSFMIITMDRVSHVLLDVNHVITVNQQQLHILMLKINHAHLVCQGIV
jgi:hypothetical protein